MSIDSLQKAIRKMKNPSMFGLDPTPELIPDSIFDEAYSQYGNTLRGIAEAYRVFCTGLLDELDDIIPAVKVQSACFEALGYEGVKVMQELLSHAKELGYYVLLDSMRGDVGNIAEIYANAMFGQIEARGEIFCPYTCDGITVNGYLGSDGIKPFLPYLKDNSQKNIFLLIRTSNKSSGEVQDLISGDRVVHTAIADLAQRWSTGLFGQCGYSEIVAVVGATRPQMIESLRNKYDRLFFMVPGYGAQGGTAKQVQYAFDRFGHGAIISASRSIIATWKREEGSDGRDYRACARRAAEKMRDDIRKYVTVL